MALRADHSAASAPRSPESPPNAWEPAHPHWSSSAGRHSAPWPATAAAVPALGQYAASTVTWRVSRGQADKGSEAKRKMAQGLPNQPGRVRLDAGPAAFML